MKKILLPAAIALIAMMMTVPTACSDKEDVAKEAAEEACDCLRGGKTLDDCIAKINADYKYSIDDAFIKAFNKAQDCDIEIYIKK